MALKNYTSSISATRSIAFIEGKLAAHGATQILKEYSSETVIAISFVLKIGPNDVIFKLPSRVEACEKVLMAQLSNRAQQTTRNKVPAQAQRTSWKILSDWVEAQVAMIELSQVDIEEVFLPYMYDPKSDKTLYQKIKETGFQGLFLSERT